MACRTDTLPHFLTDVAEAIRTKTGGSEQIQASSFDTAITNIPSGGGGNPDYTGHYDAEGLTAIDWSNSEIQYYQDNYVQWNEEFDSFYELTTSDKQKQTSALVCRYYPANQWSGSYFKDYKKLIAIPLIDTSNVTAFTNYFYACWNLMGIPLLDTHNATSMSTCFHSCYALKKVPLLDTGNVVDMTSMFANCYGIKEIPAFNMKKVSLATSMFANCRAMVSVGQLDCSDDQLTNTAKMFDTCMSIQVLDLSKLYTSHVTTMEKMFNFCLSLRKLDIRNMTFTNVGNYSNMFGANTSEGVQNDCLIIVKDATAKSWITSRFSRLYNVQTVEEYEGS